MSVKNLRCRTHIDHHSLINSHPTLFNSFTLSQTARTSLARRLGIRAWTVNVWHLRTHRAEVSGQLAAVMNAVVIRKSDPLRARHLHHPEEVQHFGMFFRGQYAQTGQRLWKASLVVLHNLVHVLELAFEFLRLLGIPFECAFRDALSEPDICSSQVKREFPRRTRFGIRFIPAIVVFDGSQDLECCRKLPLPELSHHLSRGFHVFCVHTLSCGTFLLVIVQDEFLQGSVCIRGPCVILHPDRCTGSLC